MTQNEKKSAVCQLFEMAKADGFVREEEVIIIRQMGLMMGLTDEELTELSRNPVAFDPPSNEMDRIIQFHRMTLIMNVDGYNSAGEEQRLIQMGSLYGINPNAVKDILKEMHNYPNKLVPPDKLLEIHNKYQS